MSFLLERVETLTSFFSPLQEKDSTLIPSPPFPRSGLFPSGDLRPVMPALGSIFSQRIAILPEYAPVPF